MSIAAGGLAELHQIHLQLKQVNDKLAAGPKRIAAHRQLVEKRQAEADQLRERLTEVRLAADAKSLQFKSNEKQISDLKAKLNMATSNREFGIIKSQIEADTMANSVLEDEILEILEQADEIRTKIAATETQRDAATAELERVTAEVAAVEPQLLQEAAEYKDALEAAERNLPAEVAVVYRRLVTAHGADALASVEGKACTGCFALLEPNRLVELNVGKYLFCRTCGRLMYRTETE